MVTSGGGGGGKGDMDDDSIILSCNGGGGGGKGDMDDGSMILSYSGGGGGGDGVEGWMKFADRSGESEYMNVDDWMMLTDRGGRDVMHVGLTNVDDGINTELFESTSCCIWCHWGSKFLNMIFLSVLFQRRNFL